VGRHAEQGGLHAAVELLVVEQRDGLPALNGPHQLARPAQALGREQPHAVARPLVAHALVHERVVHGPVGDLHGQAGADHRGGHQLEVREVARNEHDRPAAGGDVLQGLGARDVQALGLGGDAVDDGELGERAAHLGPLVAQQGGDLGVGGLGEHDPQVRLGDPLQRGERTQGAQQPAAEVRDRVDREQARQRGRSVERQRFNPPTQGFYR
jgi:hypothetical protein